jgi:hypothetical protein
MNGALATITAMMDPDKLELILSMEGDVKRAPVYKGIDTDFFGRPVTGDRMPGPFADLGREPATRSIDPR